jgi:hypothetical protein
VWVANHTTMIDYVVLSSYRPFAVIMQLHAGWVGFLQTQVLNSLNCLWFNRTQVRGFVEGGGGGPSLGKLVHQAWGCKAELTSMLVHECLGAQQPQLLWCNKTQVRGGVSTLGGLGYMHAH